MNPELSTKATLALSYLLLGVLGYIDYITGWELNFFLFYYAPISIVAWRLSRRSGMVMALCCAVCWYGVDLATDHPYSQAWFGVWNSGLRLLSFLILAMALSTIREDGERLNATNGRLQKTLDDLERSIAQVRKMQEQIQIVCAWTNRIRHEGRWVKFEEFLSSNLNLKFSHGMSEEAAKQMMAELDAQGAVPETDLPERRLAPQNAGTA